WIQTLGGANTKYTKARSRGCGAFSLPNLRLLLRALSIRSSFERIFVKRFLLVLGLVTLPTLLHAETGEDAWLRYARVEEPVARHYQSIPGTVIALGESALIHNAQQEMIRGAEGMLGRSFRAATELSSEPAIILGTTAALHSLAADLQPRQIQDDGFSLTKQKVRGVDCILVASFTERGVLYGTFALLRKIALGENIEYLDEVQQPYAPLRWIDQWDNLDGRIERGYAGPSIFFENGNVRADLTRA